jgi:dipeptide/tripeptide permease
MCFLLTLCSYFMPLIGGYVADAHLGRYKTIHIAIVIGIVAHIILVAASAPTVIVHKTGATAAFIIGLLTLCVGEFINIGEKDSVKTNLCDRYWFLQG